MIERHRDPLDIVCGGRRACLCSAWHHRYYVVGEDGITVIPPGFDVGFDTVGGENLPRSLEAAALEGRVTSVNTRTTADLSLLHQKALSLHVVFMVIPILHNQPEGRARHGEILREITRRVENNEFKPLIHEQRFPFEEVGSAHALLEQGGATGKIVLTGFKSS